MTVSGRAWNPARWQAAAESLRNEFDPAADVIGCRCTCEVGMLRSDMGQKDRDNLILASAAGDVVIPFTSDLPEHHKLLSNTPHLTHIRPMGNAEAMDESTRVQVCGTFVVELQGRRVDHLLPGRQGRVLFAYLVVSRRQPVSRNSLIDALWGDAPPADVGGALNALISKTRAVVGGDVLRGRSELTLALPEPAQVDVEVAWSKLHVAESAVAIGAWRRAWAPALSAMFVARRTFLPEVEAPWAEVWRRRLTDVGLRALECFAKACLGIGGVELPSAERAARELVDAAPLRESGHLLLMRALAARGNVAEALAAYERLRILLRDELGVDPSDAVQDEYVRLLA
jgi:SARP family transcriptional regulator, regulator of embCAB operon